MIDELLGCTQTFFKAQLEVVIVSEFVSLDSALLKIPFKQKIIAQVYSILTY